VGLVKILVACPFLPHPLDNGGAVRIFNLTKALSERHDVTFVCFAHDPDPDSVREMRHLTRRLEIVDRGPMRRPLAEHAKHLLSPLPYSVVMPSAEMDRAFTRLYREDAFDVVQIEFMALGHLVQAAGVPRGKRVLIEHSITTVVRERMLPFLPPWKRLYYGVDLAKLRPYERRTLRLFDVVAAVSDHDRETLRRIVPGLPVVTVPNGVDTAFFAPRPWSDGDEILFMGAFYAEQATVDSALWFARDIFPRIRSRVPSARLTIVGPQPPADVRALAGPDVEVTGYVDDVRPYLARAKALVLPIRGGSGTKIRMFTAMSAGRPVVATPMTIEGMDVRHDRDCLIASDAPAFADAVIALLENAALRERIGAAARAWAVARHDWRAVAARLEDVYASLTQRSAAPAVAPLPASARAVREEGRTS
jgi:glycosyltransferase involved in cell wall biosynthesis